MAKEENELQFSIGNMDRRKSRLPPIKKRRGPFIWILFPIPLKE